jgi:hypothetical protein
LAKDSLRIAGKPFGQLLFGEVQFIGNVLTDFCEWVLLAVSNEPQNREH